VISVVFHLVGIYAAISVLHLASRAEGGAVVAAAEAESRVLMILLAFVGEAAILVAAGTLFLVWFRRSYRNLPALGARNLRFKPGWAVGAWFVPVLGYWRPAQIANDIWKASDPEMHEAVDTPWQVRSGSALVGWWWALWLIANFAWNVPFRTLETEADMSARVLQSFAKGWVFAEFVWTASTILAILFVFRLTSRQEERARRLTSIGAGLPGLTA